MSRAYAVFERELRAYFASPMAYALLGVFLLLTGVFYFANVQQFNAICLQYGHVPQYLGYLNLNEMVISHLFGVIQIILLLMIPIITMRLIAAERRAGTIELLMTAPISPAELVAGKFLASFAFYGFMLACTAVHLSLLFTFGSPDPGPVLTGYLGLLLFGGALLAAGLFCSALAGEQIVAAILAFGITLLFWIVGWLGEAAGPGLMQDVLGYLSLIDHCDRLLDGVIHLKDVVFYLSFSAFFLFSAVKVIESANWRR
jgi:ABC-2 type transport system permease protein